eukprot:CAMPEP_0116055174 /NCGR_PEP_ID=MMETSP0322-20121206/3245_1 /TAXON_ID=163516 /ORGANISM="Leptocylindrus danicus var. apora, Strain B651" /LENGTH=720 /DNA_ID=CAMNT_0003538717 /DNA_START=31 /DNA_END=2193 /DNA_ORIENTATION=+
MRTSTWLYFSHFFALFNSQSFAKSRIETLVRKERSLKSSKTSSSITTFDSKSTTASSIASKSAKSTKVPSVVSNSSFKSSKTPSESNQSGKSTNANTSYTPTKAPSMVSKSAKSTKIPSATSNLLSTSTQASSVASKSGKSTVSNSSNKSTKTNVTSAKSSSSFNSSSEISFKSTKAPSAASKSKSSNSSFKSTKAPSPASKSTKSHISNVTSVKSSSSFNSSSDISFKSTKAPSAASKSSKSSKASSVASITSKSSKAPSASCKSSKSSKTPSTASKSSKSSKAPSAASKSSKSSKAPSTTSKSSKSSKAPSATSKSSKSSKSPTAAPSPFSIKTEAPAMKSSVQPTFNASSKPSGIISDNPSNYPLVPTMKPSSHPMFSVPTYFTGSPSVYPSKMISNSPSDHPLEPTTKPSSQYISTIPSGFPLASTMRPSYVSNRPTVNTMNPVSPTPSNTPTPTLNMNRISFSSTFYFMTEYVRNSSRSSIEEESEMIDVLKDTLRIIAGEDIQMRHLTNGETNFITVDIDSLYDVECNVGETRRILKKTIGKTLLRREQAETSCAIITSTVNGTVLPIEREGANGTSLEIMSKIENSMSPVGTSFIELTEYQALKDVTYLGSGFYLPAQTTAPATAPASMLNEDEAVSNNEDGYVLPLSIAGSIILLLCALVVSYRLFTKKRENLKELVESEIEAYQQGNNECSTSKMPRDESILTDEQNMPEF